MATTGTTTTTSTTCSSTLTKPWPVYDLFLDVPHPAASSSSPVVWIGSQRQRRRQQQQQQGQQGPSGESKEEEDEEENNIEQELSKNISQISRFAFPEYEDNLGGGGGTITNPSSSSSSSASSSSTSISDKSSSNNNSNKSLNRYDRYFMQCPSFQDYTFSLQLQSGQRVHGHVRRYLPCHSIAKTRYDLGRRCERALVLLTRATGADAFYASVLKTMEALFSQQSIALPENNLSQIKSHEWFLQQLDARHRHLASYYISKENENRRGNSLMLSIQGLELGSTQVFSQVDTSHFLVPSCLLAVAYHHGTRDNLASFSSSSMLPLLRRLGVAHTLRLMSALLSERRVILVSSSPTRLACCARSAISILAQGMLHWQHIYIPVLPPHLWQYLAAPMPYLIGILTNLTPRLDHMTELGEVLIIHLDTNAMETRGMQVNSIQKRIPDLFLPEQMQLQQQVVALGQMNAAPTSPSEYLAQDLVELLKQDKKILFGESIVANVAEQTAKASKAVQSTFRKLKEKSRQYIKQNSGNFDEQQQNQESNSSSSSKKDTESDAQPDTNTMAPDYIYIEGSRNEAGERDARVAFTSFFLALYGNLKWYLTAASTPGQSPHFDKQKFLQQKRALGDTDSTPLGALLMNFVHTQMLEEFVKARVDEIFQRQTVASDSPLFLRATVYLRQNNVDYTILNIQRVVHQMAHGADHNKQTLYAIQIRKEAMLLTSKKDYPNGEYNQALSRLVERCRESSSALFDVMSVVWMRIRDSKGMNWKHAYNSLQLLRNLLLHGPLAAIAEATDGLCKIRNLKYYNDTMRSQNCVYVRQAAEFVYTLLVDRAKLFMARRICANRRRVMKEQGSNHHQRKAKRDPRMKLSISFRQIHPALHPGLASSRRQQVAPAQQQQQQQQQTPSNDLRQMQLNAAHGPSSAGSVQTQTPPASISNYDDLLNLGATVQSATTTTTSNQYSNDLLGLFGDMAVSTNEASASTTTPSAAPDLFAPTAYQTTTTTPTTTTDMQSRSISPSNQKQQERSVSPRPTYATIPPSSFSTQPMVSSSSSLPSNRSLSPVPNRQHGDASFSQSSTYPSSSQPPSTRNRSLSPTRNQQQQQQNTSSFQSPPALSTAGLSSYSSSPSQPLAMQQNRSLSPVNQQQQNTTIQMQPAPTYLSSQSFSPANTFQVQPPATGSDLAPQHSLGTTPQQHGAMRNRSLSPAREDSSASHGFAGAAMQFQSQGQQFSGVQQQQQQHSLNPTDYSYGQYPSVGTMQQQQQQQQQPQQQNPNPYPSVGTMQQQHQPQNPNPYPSIGTMQQHPPQQNPNSYPSVGSMQQHPPQQNPNPYPSVGTMQQQQQQQHQAYYAQQQGGIYNNNNNAYSGGRQ